MHWIIIFIILTTLPAKVFFRIYLRIDFQVVYSSIFLRYFLKLCRIIIFN